MVENNSLLLKRNASTTNAPPTHKLRIGGRDGNKSNRTKSDFLVKSKVNELTRVNNDEIFVKQKRFSSLFSALS